MALVAGALVLSGCETAAPASPAPASVAHSRSVAPTSSSPLSPSSSASSTASPGGVPDELKVLFILDPSVEGAEELATPASQAAALAFAAANAAGGLPAPIELVSFELSGDAAGIDALVEEVASEPTYVGALIAPGLAGQRVLVTRLDIPVVSLSSRDRPEEPAPGSWLRMVPRIEDLGAAVGEVASGLPGAASGMCIAPGVTDGSRLARAAERAADPGVPIIDTAGPVAISDAGCGVVLWTGDATSAVEAIDLLGRPGPRFVGGPALREPVFLEETGTTADGSLAVCGCADLSTSLELPAQRFIQDFQSEYGQPPGPGAVEAWDAARLIVRGLTEGGPAATDLAAWIAALHRFDGLGGRYRFDASGELADPLTHIVRYRVEGGRWLPVSFG